MLRAITTLFLKVAFSHSSFLTAFRKRKRNCKLTQNYKSSKRKEQTQRWSAGRLTNEADRRFGTRRTEAREVSVSGKTNGTKDNLFPDNQKEILWKSIYTTNDINSKRTCTVFFFINKRALLI